MIAEATALIDAFFASTRRNLIPSGEVEDFLLDLRQALTHKPNGEERPHSTAERLRAAVEFLDLGDKAFETVANLNGIEHEAGTGVQADLSLLADWFDAHPDLDTEAHGFVEDRCLT